MYCYHVLLKNIICPQYIGRYYFPSYNYIIKLKLERKALIYTYLFPSQSSFLFVDAIFQLVLHYPAWRAYFNTPSSTHLLIMNFLRFYLPSFLIDFLNGYKIFTSLQYYKDFPSLPSSLQHFCQVSVLIFVPLYVYFLSLWLSFRYSLCLWFSSVSLWYI